MESPLQHATASPLGETFAERNFDGTDHGWMISFVDILMLLLTLFVLLLAFQTLQKPPETPAELAADINPGTPVVKSKPAAATAVVEPVAQSTQAPQPETTAQPAAAAEALWLALQDRHSTAALVTALETPAVTSSIVEPEPTPASEPAASTPPTPAASRLEIPAAVRDRVEVAVSADAVNLIIKDEVLFDRASADLKPDAHRILDSIAALLKANAFAVSVEGHTDDTPISTSRYPSNWDLSVARATHVTRYLIARGVERQRLRAVGYADTRPLDRAGTAVARARNRRVSLVVHLREPDAAPRQPQALQQTPDAQG